MAGNWIQLWNLHFSVSLVAIQFNGLGSRQHHESLGQWHNNMCDGVESYNQGWSFPNGSTATAVDRFSKALGVGALT